MKLLHTADIHLGAKLNFLGAKGPEHREHLKQAFAKSIELAISEDADLFLIGGDLFDSNSPSQATLNFALNALKKLTAAGIFVALTPGNHDPLNEYSVYLNKVWQFDPEHFHIFTDPGVNVWEIGELDLAVYSYAVKAKKSSRDPLPKELPQSSAKYRVGLFHGSVDLKGEPDNYPLYRARLRELPLNYIALGDWHNQLEVSKSAPVTWYCGSPEALASDQDSAGKVLLVELNGAQTKVTPLFTGSVRVANRTLDISGMTSPEAVREAVKEEDARDVVLNLVITGVKSLDLELDVTALAETLRQEYFWVNIKDASSLALTAKDLARFSGQLVTGRYIEFLDKYKQEHPERAASVDIAIQKGIKLLTVNNDHATD